MNKNIEYLQLEADDDVTTVRDRLAFLRGKRVLLIWPEQGTPLQRKLDLVLIQREAVRRAVRLAIVTHNDDVIHHAQELNISTFETIKAGERGKWKRGSTRVFLNRIQRPEEIDPDDLMPYASRVRTPAQSIRRLAFNMITRTLTLGILGGVVVAIAFLVIPSAQVVIMPELTQLTSSVSITADPTREQSNVDVENAIMPATLLRVEVEERATLPTTGILQLETVPATGRVTFINRSQETVEIPAGSLVSTSAGTPIVFRTLSSITLDSNDGQQAETTVEAIPESSGLVGNVDAGLINTLIGPLADLVEVRNLVPTTGGEEDSLRTVTQEDHERLIAVLRQQLQERAFRELEPRITGQQLIIPETVNIAEERNDWMTFNYAVGDAAENLTLTMRARVEVTAVDLQIAQQIAYARLSAQIPAGQVIQPNTIQYALEGISQITTNGRVSFNLNASGVVGVAVNAGAIQQQLASLNTETALLWLQSTIPLAEGTTPTITVSPEWLPILPILSQRIQVRIDSALPQPSEERVLDADAVPTPLPDIDALAPSEAGS